MMQRYFLLGLLTCLVALHLPFRLIAQSDSYLYLEGIRGLPAFIEIDNIPQSVMGKNYFLIPLKKSGEIQVHINFNGDLYPKQNFVLDALPGSSYAFRLAKTAEDKFYLMDLINTGKIVELNTNVNIALSTEQNKINFFIPSTPSPIDTLEDMTKTKRKRKRKIDTEVEADSVQVTENKGPNGIVAIYSEKQIETPPAVEKKITPPATVTRQEPACKRMASEEEVQSSIEKIRQKNDDDTRLLILKRRVFTGCLEVKSVRQIAEIFDTQFGRYGAIRFLRNFMKDPENLADLESLLKTSSYKEKLFQLK